MQKSSLFRLGSAFAVLSPLLCTVLIPRDARAQEPGVVTTSFSIDPRGTVVSATLRGSAYDPSRILVRFRNGAPHDFLPGSGPPNGFPTIPNLFVVPTPPGLSVAEAVARYKANPSVLYAEPDFVVHTVNTTPTDPLWNKQWDMVKISAPSAWDTQTDAADVVVAVIDTGIDFTHEDLQGNLWTGSGGAHGFDCTKGRCAKGGDDDFGHGTHVAGTIGAVANNGKGIAGINWKIQLLSIKFLDSNGSGSISGAVAAFDQVTQLKQQGVNIRVTNNSWGGTGFSQALKDSMAQAETAGVVHVCAAGNNYQNSDAFPLYPAAYDNHGIVSVLASDQNDSGASFTNFGLASVDLAAPGVSTLSTVPTGTCTLCDPSGYKLLSGTSMATPHVAGVLAALFHINPNRSVNEGRDVVLDPTSYDTLRDVKAQTTSTGGRLNYNKAIHNPRLLLPSSQFTLNNFPVVTTGPNLGVASGSQVNLTASVSDADNDSLRQAWTKSPPRVTSGWLLAWMLNLIFPNPASKQPSSFTAPSLARIATVPYDLSVADGRGGGAHGRQFVTVSPGTSTGVPSATLSVSPSSGPPGTTVTLNFTVSDPDRDQIGWDIWTGMKNAATGWCCFTGSSAQVTLNDAGLYRISLQAMDQELNLANRPTVVVRIGGATGDPPIASATADKLSGPLPLTVNLDMSGSSAPGSSIRNYFFNCNDGTFTAGAQKYQGSCTYDTAGAHWIALMVQDNNFNVDLVSIYVVATP